MRRFNGTRQHVSYSLCILVVLMTGLMSSEHEVDLMNLFYNLLREVLSYYLRGFEFAMLQGFRDCYAMLCLPSTRPSSYCVHRAIRTIAIYTVTSAVTIHIHIRFTKTSRQLLDTLLRLIAI